MPSGRGCCRSFVSAGLIVGMVRQVDDAQEGLLHPVEPLVLAGARIAWLQVELAVDRIP